MNYLAERKKKCENDVDFSFGIEYENPEDYLVPGEQSDLSDAYLGEVRATLERAPNKDMYGVFRVCQWVSQNFTFENAGGAMIGKKSVNELFEIKTFYGCHSHALIISSILRGFGIPAVMIETASVQWGFEYKAGAIQNFAGHVMSEIYIDNKWILLDNNCTYVVEYDCMNPYIFTKNPNYRDLFVLAKGVDTWEYFEKNESDTHNMMIEFSDNIYCFADMFYTVKFKWNN